MPYHVRQRGPFDCGIAVAAALTETSYEQVFQLMPLAMRRRGLKMDEMSMLIRAMGLGTREVYFPGPPGFVEDVLGPWKASAAVLITIWGHERGHWIAWNGKTVSDPALRTLRPLETYRFRRHWVAGLVLPF